MSTPLRLPKENLSPLNDSEEENEEKKVPSIGKKRRTIAVEEEEEEEDEKKEERKDELMRHAIGMIVKDGVQLAISFLNHNIFSSSFGSRSIEIWHECIHSGPDLNQDFVITWNSIVVDPKTRQHLAEHQVLFKVPPHKSIRNRKLLLSYVIYERELVRLEKGIGCTVIEGTMNKMKWLKEMVKVWCDGNSRLVTFWTTTTGIENDYMNSYIRLIKDPQVPNLYEFMGRYKEVHSLYSYGLGMINVNSQECDENPFLNDFALIRDRLSIKSRLVVGAVNPLFKGCYNAFHERELWRDAYKKIIGDKIKGLQRSEERQEVKKFNQQLLHEIEKVTKECKEFKEGTTSTPIGDNERFLQEIQKNITEVVKIEQYDDDSKTLELITEMERHLITTTPVSSENVYKEQERRDEFKDFEQPCACFPGPDNTVWIINGCLKHPYVNVMGIPATSISDSVQQHELLFPITIIKEKKINYISNNAIVFEQEGEIDVFLEGSFRLCRVGKTTLAWHRNHIMLNDPEGYKEHERNKAGLISNVLESDDPIQDQVLNGMKKSPLSIQDGKCEEA